MQNNKKEACLQSGRKYLPALKAHLSKTRTEKTQPDNQTLLKTYLGKESN